MTTFETSGTPPKALASWQDIATYARKVPQRQVSHFFFKPRRGGPVGAIWGLVGPGPSWSVQALGARLIGKTGVAYSVCNTFYARYSVDIQKLEGASGARISACAVELSGLCFGGSEPVPVQM